MVTFRGKISANSLALAVTLGLLGVPTAIHAAEPANSKPAAVSDEIGLADKRRIKLITQKLRLVTAMLNSSAVVRASKAKDGATGVRQQYLAVNQTLERVRSDMDAGRLNDAERNVGDALKSIIDLTRRARATDTVTQKKERKKQKARFEELRKSVTAIRKSLKEAIVKKEIQTEQGTLQQLDLLISQADALADNRKFTKAVRKLSKAQNFSETAVVRLRAGETVVYDLKFKSPEEEYRYEVERNRSHIMLLNVMMDEKAVSQGTRNLIEARISQSRTIRDRAAEHVETGDIEGAIDLMEQATQNLSTALLYLGPQTVK